MSKGGEAGIPSIDLQECPFPYGKLKEACEEWGCFRVVNHSVPPTVMSEMKIVSTSLFDLPVEMKKRNTCPSPGRGYIGIAGSGHLSCIFETIGLSPSCPEAIRNFSSQLDLSSSQRATVEMYSRATGELMDDIANKIATSLGLVGDKDMFKDWFFHMRMYKYDFTTETIGSPGLGSHTDANFLTVLQDDELVRGLQVEDKSAGCFVSVEQASSPGSLLVVLGDMAVVWSNGRFTNSKHRVECMDANSVRVSIASFKGGPMESPVEAPKSVVDDSHQPRLYAPVYFKQYSELRKSSKMSHGENLSLFRLD